MLYAAVLDFKKRPYRNEKHRILMCVIHKDENRIYSFQDICCNHGISKS